MKLIEAQAIANEVREELLPHCYRCEIAGSIRRKKAEVKDIEIVLIPHPYHTGLFTSGIALVIDKWEKVRGELGPECRYTQRYHPQEGIKIDIFFAQPDNWGLIYAIRTGSADYSHLMLASVWAKRGFKSVDGFLRHKDDLHTIIPLREEQDLFDLLHIHYEKPENRFVRNEPGMTVGRGVPSKFEKTHGDFNGFIDF